MLVQITAAASIDYLQQLAALLRDPVCYGRGITRGNGEPVLLVPGYTAGDWTLGTMARWLSRIGYRPYLSGIDLNLGCPRRKLELLQWRAQEIVRHSGRRAAVIGHSLGGVLGRALARTAPELIHHVVALGSPARDGLKAVSAEVRPAIRAMQALWRLLSTGPDSCGTERCECGFLAAAFAPCAPARFTAIFTRRDEVVDWKTCLDPAGANHEVDGLHASLIVNREVYRLLASILAEGSGAAAAA
jgi:triacylglycerol lipase